MTAAHIEVASLSLAGGHLENEDAFVVEELPGDPACFLCALADGQGGQAGGGQAARGACAVSIAETRRRSPVQLLLSSTWSAIVGAADLAVSRYPDAGFCTLVTFAVTERMVCGASCGDSALVLITGNRRNSVLTDPQPKNPPIGSGGAMAVPFSTVLSPPWMPLAMSDGVWKYAGWDRIADIDPNLSAEAAINTLHEAAKLPRSGALQDDFTVVALRKRAF